MKEFVPRESVKVEEVFDGHSFEDDCAWEPLQERKLSMRNAFLSAKKIKTAEDFAALSIRNFIAQDSRAAVRTFADDGERFSAWDYLPGSVVKLDMGHVYKPLGAVHTYNDSGLRWGVVVLLGEYGESDMQVKIAVARTMEFGKVNSISFDMHEPEIDVNVTRHLKLSVPGRRKGEDRKLQDLFRVRSVNLLTIGKGQRPHDGKRRKVWSLFGSATTDDARA